LSQWHFVIEQALFKSTFSRKPVEDGKKKQVCDATGPNRIPEAGNKK
jgi:hypothetical protein